MARAPWPRGAPEHSNFIWGAIEQSDISRLLAPHLLDFHQVAMKEAARHARDSIVVKKPPDSRSRWIAR
eukprot:1972267-Pyramimonas_sp.AAC.1